MTHYLFAYKTGKIHECRRGCSDDGSPCYCEEEESKSKTKYGLYITDKPATEIKSALHELLASMWFDKLYIFGLHQRDPALDDDHGGYDFFHNDSKGR